MVKLTRLNGRKFVLNSDLIKFIEETPDTIITLRDQEKVIVREDADEVIRRVIEFRRSERLLPD
jgi:flagellar protein FlbD